jgi:hypothetical protein
MFSAGKYATIEKIRNSVLAGKNATIEKKRNNVLAGKYLTMFWRENTQQCFGGKIRNN